jgi:hypothetical protein
VLASPAFIVALLALVGNDFLLKGLLHDWLTGKLSDFAGLFVFATLVLACLPRRPRAALAATALLFAWWKSPLSQPFIELGNTLLPFTLHRTVDVTDLLAFAVLPAAWANFVHWRRRGASRFIVYPVGLAAVLAVTATTFAPPFSGGAVHLEDAGVASQDSVEGLYAAIDEFAIAHGYALPEGDAKGRQRDYRGGYGSLSVNYDPGSSTLYYGFGGYGPSSSTVAALDKEFVERLSGRYPGIKVEPQGRWAGPRAFQYSKIHIWMPGFRMGTDGCDDGGYTNPDFRLIYASVHAFAAENGLEELILPEQRSDSPCKKGAYRLYTAGAVHGPYADSRSLVVRISMYMLNSGTSVDLKFSACCGMEARAADLNASLKARLAALHFENPNITLDDGQEPVSGAGQN